MTRKKTVIVTATYSTQTTACSQVVCGEKFRVPLRIVPRNELARDRAADVEGEVVQARQDAGLLQVVHAVAEHAGGHHDQDGAGPGEELGRG